MSELCEGTLYLLLWERCGARMKTCGLSDPCQRRGTTSEKHHRGLPLSFPWKRADNKVYLFNTRNLNFIWSFVSAGKCPRLWTVSIHGNVKAHVQTSPALTIRQPAGGMTMKDLGHDWFRCLSVFKFEMAFYGNGQVGNLTFWNLYLQTNLNSS